MKKLLTSIYYSYLCKTNPTGIESYRPILLLNVDHKIVSKVYANRTSACSIRLKYDLRKPCFWSQCSVPPKQRCFWLAFFERCNWSYSNWKTRCLCLSIDFYKAFDCVNHIFLKKVLKCSGFSDTFCDRIFTLFQNSETGVFVNGFISNFFPVNRGIRQGNLFSLYLFLVFIEPMFRLIMLKNLIGDDCIPGSNAFVIKYFAYADDVTLMLLEIYSVSKVFDLSLEYEMAPGL